MFRLLLPVAALLFLASTSFAQGMLPPLPTGTYQCDGRVDGEAVIATSTTGTITTDQYGADRLKWNPMTGYYDIYDGPTAQPEETPVARVKILDGVYNVQYQEDTNHDGQFSDDGTGTWTA